MAAGGLSQPDCIMTLNQNDVMAIQTRKITGVNEGLSSKIHPPLGVLQLQLFNAADKS